MERSKLSSAGHAVRRTQILYAGIVLIVSIFIIRLFYLQIIRYDHYHVAALNDQLKQSTIPATRGIIEAESANGSVPIVLNQTLYTVYADPTFIKNSPAIAAKLATILGGNASQYETVMKTPHTEYAVLATKVTQAQKDQIVALKYPGIGAIAQDYRTYPQGSLASQLLGFVNNSGQGEYGIEQALNSQLAGTPGMVKAITDVNGVPLAASGDNVQTRPQAGDNVLLTIDDDMQYKMEQALSQEYQKTKSQGLSAIIIDPSNGQIKAMANYPTYNPADYQSVTDSNLFNNAAVTNAIEPGSSMKTLTASTALNVNVVQPNTSFYDPAHWVIDGFNITDVEQDGGAREQNIASILSLSLNTGAVWLLMQMSNPGGTQINQKGITTWNDYMINHFRFGQPTGVEQGYEANGYVPPANFNNPSIDLTYANTAFGQGVQVTALQMASALSSVVNGGTYYRPTLVAQTTNPNTGQTVTNQPKVLEKNVVSTKTSQEIIPLMQNVVTSAVKEGYSFMSFDPHYMVGGKTGTAQVAQPGGGYYSNIFNGTYVGFVGVNKPQYVIVVFNIKPNVPGFAGALGGQPVFADLVHMLIDNGYVNPS